MAKKNYWFKMALQLRGSVIPAILSRVILCGVFGGFISLVYLGNKSISQPILGTIVPSIVLGLLLVFRTNTAYERFWEGRKCWGILIAHVRNLAREIWVAVKEKTPEDRQNKISVLYLLVAFAVATKLHLRKEPINSELKSLMPQKEYYQLKTMNNPPLEVAFWIGDYLQQQYDRKCLKINQLVAMQASLNSLTEGLGACERILNTPMPLAYAIHLKQLLLIYCLLLPFQIVKDLGLWTGLIVALISFTLFGIEEIGVEIENPFGYDANDLPLDTICDTMKRNIDDLITLTPMTHADSENEPKSA